ncbi:MAG: PTS sugar transporter subunit IIA [Spirochaetota bacterium]
MAYFDPGSVIWELKSNDKYDAIREIIYGAPVFTEHASLELDEFSHIVIEREKLQSTGFGHGVAVAHGRTDRVDEPTIALGISHEGIDFEAYDGKPVHLLFIVANHPDHQMNYLHILSTLVAMVRDELFRREILNCAHARAVQEKLCDVFTRLMEQQRLRAVGRGA